MKPRDRDFLITGFLRGVAYCGVLLFFLPPLTAALAGSIAETIYCASRVWAYRVGLVDKEEELELPEARVLSLPERKEP